MTNPKYERIKEKMLNLGIVIPGTIREVHLKCGKQNCRCAGGENKDLHGPYFFWDRKVRGNLSSMSISKENVEKIKKWINNKAKLEKIVQEILECGLQEASKLKKTRKSTRGK